MGEGERRVVITLVGCRVTPCSPRGRLKRQHPRDSLARLSTAVATTDLPSVFINEELTEAASFGAARRRAAPAFTTASSQKRRKLAPFQALITEALPDAPSTELFDTNGLLAHERSSPSASPLPPFFPDTNSQAPSPSSSHTTRTTTPPRFIPPHLHDEVLQSKEFGAIGQTEGASPSSAFAEIQIDSGSSVDMSGSENGGSSSEQQQQRVATPPRRVRGARSVSPAKRSLIDMEDVGYDMNHTQQTLPGSSQSAHEDERTGSDEAIERMKAEQESLDSQETPSNSMVASMHGTDSTTTSATSLQTEHNGSAYPDDKNDSSKGLLGTRTAANPPIDAQIRQVYGIATQPLDEGVRGHVVSTKWLARVISRGSEGLKDSSHPKETREGDIGNVDNSDLIPEGAFDGIPLHDLQGRAYVPLKRGLEIEQDYQVLPEKAWGLIVGWYGLKLGQRQIERYAHNTADPPAENIQYEMYPPVVTIRKVPQPGKEAHHPARRTSSIESLRLKKEREARGQMSPDDAIHFVSSRKERFQKFLLRSKYAAGIPRSTKVKLWRLLDPKKVAADSEKKTETGVSSPPESRSASPVKPMGTGSSMLVLSATEFKDMEIGKDIEYIDASDETNNEKYNGSSTMDTFGLFEDQTILLEEQIGGPAGGEFSSDSKKKSRSLLKNSSKDSSKPGSATASGGTSPASGGMTTRGRARRDGRTRGTVGLTNLGNTCYMNSALQCIRSVEELALYFLSQRYKKEINSANPLGHAGAMAKQYAQVLSDIYTDRSIGAVTPSTFKKMLGNIQPLFSGYQQQDSQEFLSFLVDALHEDLNRIEKKPYNENPDSDDKTVHDPQAIIELGEIYRKNHRARNDSVAMDLFNGFYKNTMECPVCDKISITFDPYSLLTVQLPIENTFQHTITFIPLLGAPINHAIDFDKNATIKMLKEDVASKHPGVHADRLWMAEVYNHKIYKVFENHQTLHEAGIQSNDYIFMFQLQYKPSNVPDLSKKKSYLAFNTYSTYSNDREIPSMDSEKADRMAVPIFMRQRSRVGNHWDATMHPLYILVSREEAHDFETILRKVLVAVSRQTSRPILTEFREDKLAPNGVATAVPNAAEDEPSTEDTAQISDRSVPSEDGYVEVSVTMPEQPASSNAMSDVDGVKMTKTDDRPIPPRFMDPQYFLSPSLRNHLFALNYAMTSSDGGMNCASMSSFEERSVRNMFDRVKLPARRASVQSSSSEDSTTSTGSTTQLDAETEQSDVDEDEPDVRIGDGQPLTVYSASIADSDEDETLADNPFHNSPLDNPARGVRSQRGKADNFARNRKQKNASKKERRRLKKQRNRPNGRGSLHLTQPQRSIPNKQPPDADSPYYIQLGEAIVLDWYAEGQDALFGGNANADDEMRGHWLSTNDGRALDFWPDPVLEEKRAKRLARKKNGISLEDCFVETGKREILSEDNAWYCNRCKEMRQAAKTLEIWTIPDILIVHLKRFGGNRSFRDKIDVNVEYPIEGLDMTEKVGLKEGGREYTYDLFAVDNHYGGLGGGHYTALAKNFYDGQWYDYNDTMCSKVSDAKLQSAAAYLLFYRRRSDKPLGPQYLQDIANSKRNPEAEFAAGEAEDSEGGEGRLGGPNGLLHGSSSALVGVGAGTNASLPNLGDGLGAGIAAGSNLTQRQTATTKQGNDGEGLRSPLGFRDGKPILGPQRPPHMMQYGGVGSQWSFDTLDHPTRTDGDTETQNLLSTVDRDDDEHGSTIAEHDSAYGGEVTHFVEPMDQDSGSDRAYTQWMGLSVGVNTPVEASDIDNDWEDKHGLYSGAHDQRQDADVDALHLEDAGAIGEASDDPPTHELHLEDEEMLDVPREQSD